MGPVISASNVSKRFGSHQALDTVSLSVERGTVFALIGPNGAGKTTMVRCLTGTLQPDHGTIQLLNGTPSRNQTERIGVLPQSFAPPGRLSAKEIVTYYAGLYDAQTNPAQTLNQVGLTDKLNTRYNQLSGGEQRRVCLATALVHNPEVLFLDEPTTGVDPVGRRTIWELIDKLTSSEVTVFLTTHDMKEAQWLAHKVGMLADGELIASGSPGELIAEYGGTGALMVTSDDPTAVLSTVGEDGTVRGETAYFEDIAATDIETILSTLTDNNISYTGINWREPDLEDVYLRLASDPAIEPTTDIPISEVP